MLIVKEAAAPAAAYH